MRVAIHVRPGVSSSTVGGEYGGALVVRVVEPADRGRATAAALKAVADEVGVLRHCVKLVNGATSRRKVIDIECEDSPTIDFLTEQMDSGFIWIEQTSATVQAEASTELKAALGVLRNLAFAARRQSTGEDNSALRRSCDALIAQSHLHIETAARSVDDAARGSL